MSKLPDKLKELAVDQAKHEDSDGYFGFLTGAEWMYAHLANQAPEFNDLACEDAALEAGCVKIVAGKPGTHHMDNEYFDEGARWQYEQDRASIAAISVKNDALIGTNSVIKAELAEAKSEIERLRYGHYKDDHRYHPLKDECDKLKAECIGLRELNSIQKTYLVAAENNEKTLKADIEHLRWRDKQREAELERIKYID